VLAVGHRCESACGPLGPEPDKVVSGVAVGATGDVFTVHRNGRSWADRMLGEVIDVPVVHRWNSAGDLVESFGAGLFRHPHGISVDPLGRVWVTDVGLHQVFCLSPGGEVQHVLGTRGEMGRDPAHFALPTGVAINQSGRIFASDGYGNARVMEFDPDGSYVHGWGREGAGDGEFRLPHAIDSDKTLVVADRLNQRLQLFSFDGDHLESFDHVDIGNPFGVATMGAALVVVECGFPTVERAALVVVDKLTGSVERFAERGSPDGLVCPHDVAVYESTVYVADAVTGLRCFTLEQDQRAQAR